ncbi:manganese-dependent inorganic pyrophosphatase [Ornithinibacillus sp. 4-3]|uniref:Probable manganese-dependent inorganic pyrophosphatase n=1 Tax=Ornithinibacillus sp. 4-3 TaxID=3231488 RepID=A0AB39HKP3_9BACI
MNKTLVFGHKNPDTDTICSAIACADLKNKLGGNVEAVRLGAVGKETQFALDYFGAELPRLIEQVEDAEQVILVDHNEFQQSVDNIKDVRIAEVIDHHRVSNFETDEPLYFRAEPVGCTATILYKMYKENDVEISKQVAGLLLSAIVSDSLLFKSPTCTEEDIAAAKELEKLADVDVNTYGLDMLQAGVDLSDKTIAEVLTMDAKEFAMHDAKVEIAQVNTVNTAEVYSQQAEFEAEIEKKIAENGLDLFVFVVTDIINSNSEVLALGTGQAKVEAAFGVALENNRALLEGVVSRKKQVVPSLTNAFA